MTRTDDAYKIIEKVRELTNGNSCEPVIEFTGKEWPLNLVGEQTSEHGMLIIAGFYQDGRRQVNILLWNWHGPDIINVHELVAQKYLKKQTVSRGSRERCNRPR